MNFNVIYFLISKGGGVRWPGFQSGHGAGVLEVGRIFVSS